MTDLVPDGRHHLGHPETPPAPRSMPAHLSAAELRDAGYLAEANRRFFHPLGLALGVNVAADSVCVFDDRTDPEGWYFADVDDDLVTKAHQVREEERRRRPARVRALGYWLQPVRQGAWSVDEIPEALSDEDGSSWCAAGHISDEAMVLAVIVEQAINIGADEAAALLVGWPTDHPRSVDQRRTATELLGQVDRCWLVEHPENDELMVRCDPADPGAEPYTVLSL